MDFITKLVYIILKGTVVPTYRQTVCFDLSGV